MAKATDLMWPGEHVTQHVGELTGIGNRKLVQCLGSRCSNLEAP